MANKKYWQEREQAEKKWMARNLANDEQFNTKLQQYYQRAVDNINKDIDTEMAKIVDENGNSVNAYKSVSKSDMEAYKREAKQVVAQAETMRKKGKYVTYADFSDEVNQRMRVYNATMRLNRLELLKSQIGVNLVGATVQSDSELQQKLGNDYISELKRQAGIMKVAAEPSMWTGKKVAKIVMTQTGGTSFSKRFWANQDVLKARLDEVLTNGIIQGQSSRKMAVRLKSQVKDTVNNHCYVTERIARTESARVQYTAQIDSIKKNGYRFVQWFAEPKACVTCSHIVHQDNGYGPGVYKINKVPRIPDDTHPNCRCSISETWVDGERNLALSNDEQSALNRYISSDSYKINDDLRRKLTTKSEQLMITMLDAALQKMPVYSSDTPLQRDYFFNNQNDLDSFIDNFEIGGTFEDPAYVSTSKLHYGNGKETIHVIIKSSKTGRDISEFNMSEQEVLFPRNTRFRIDDAYIDKHGNMTMVWSELDG
ncbi:ADP-ribosyltransferase [Limosilactobacillus fastidiosus]|nr:ADP-ribosyltransferase [Limosilactobacillus fastidiosus]MCD7086244.1 phage head morphogenesis protein [Limosilactobacillus fastidiosus]MCD7115007.1 phage head morphogenesis protein [Limosilactobacillus fastidiosus]MCD7116830.1 phage head morphogenesis protein [Limosilactobacillus fastidiosus]